MPSAPATSDDPAALGAMLAAERIENERLRKIIRELQRHRFGRRAESLPLDQLQLGLEEAEQAEAADEAVAEEAAPSVRAARVAKRRADRGALTLYVDDGRVEMDSNTVERSIRPLALTRKNALFAGSDRGGQTWAVIASLVETCKLNGVDPQAYLCDVISRIVSGHPQSQLDKLLPWAYPTIPWLRAAA